MAAIKHLGANPEATTSPEAQLEEVEPYFHWRLLALEQNAILLCSGTHLGGDLHTQDLIIIENELMDIWLRHHIKTHVSASARSQNP